MDVRCLLKTRLIETTACGDDLFLASYLLAQLLAQRLEMTATTTQVCEMTKMK